MKMATDAGDKELLEMHDDATAEEIIERLRKQIEYVYNKIIIIIIIIIIILFYFLNI